jgi:hypothetical protein
MKMALKFKMSDDGSTIIVDSKGLPIVINDNDPDNPKEFGLDALLNYRQLPQLREESKKNRLAKEAAENKLKFFSDANIDLDDESVIIKFIDDTTKALETVKNLEDKKLIDAGEVEIIKAQAQESLKKKMELQQSQFDKEKDKLSSSVLTKDAVIYKLMVSDEFNKSKFVVDKLNQSPRLIKSHFGNCFKVEKSDNGDGTVVVAYYPDSKEKVYSEENIGEPAGFDEALNLLVERDADRDSFLKGAGSGGSGAGGGGGGGGGSQPNPFMKKTFNLTKQAEYLRENPKLYERYKAEAITSGDMLG